MESSASKTIVFRYTNWRGEVSSRKVLPQGLWFGSTEWHPTEQWFLRGQDVEKGEVRDFALQDIEFDRRSDAPPSALKQAGKDSR
jgi:predicted DNA-binding transcriptional regulator YafY